MRWYYFGARYYDAEVGRWFSPDPLASDYPWISPYAYVLNSPLNVVDPNGKEVTVTSDTTKDGKVTITLTLTAKVINDSDQEFTNEQLQEFANQIAKGFEDAFSFTDGNVTVKAVANVTVATEQNPLTKTDHAIRLANPEDVPGAEFGLIAYGSPGNNYVYLSTELLSRSQPARDGRFAGTGLTAGGSSTLYRSGAHEIGHTMRLGHPQPRTLPRNLMHQSRRWRDAGMEIIIDQVLKIRRLYRSGRLNRGLQKWPSK